MTEADSYYYILRMRDELIAQSGKLNKIVEQLEAQTKLQEGILKQLYLLCQIAAAPNAQLKAQFSSESDEVFMNTPFPGSKPNEN